MNDCIHQLLSGVGVFDSLRHEKHLIGDLDDAIAHAREHIAEQTDIPGRSDSG